MGNRFAAVFLLGPPVAGTDRKLIESGGADLLLDRTLRAGADRHHRKHGRDAHADADHCQQRLQAVAADRRKRLTTVAMAEAVYLNDWMLRETAHVR
jgi:hypothetical protein